METYAEQQKRIREETSFLAFNLSMSIFPGFSKPDWAPATPAQSKVRDLVVACKADVTTMNWAWPCYTSINDRIYMTKLERFIRPYMFYHVLLHELGHWTGNQEPIRRECYGPYSKKLRLYLVDPLARILCELQEEITADRIAKHFSIAFELDDGSIADRRVARHLDHCYEDVGSEGFSTSTKEKVLFQAQADADRAIQYLEQF